MHSFYKKVFLFIFFIIIFLVFIQFYFISQNYKIDRNSYATLIRWNATLKTNWDKKVLKINEKNLVKVWDVISTIWDESILVIEWWDKSITRLWGNSRIVIKENYVSEDLDKINISFELLRWKTWSSVMSILWEDSYFIEKNKNVLAAVRWTVFEADYDKSYIACHDHSVDIIKDWEFSKEKIIKKLFSSNIFSLKDDNILTFNDLPNLIDKKFVLENKKLDQEYIRKLTKEFKEKFLSSNPLNTIYVYFRSFNNPEFKVVQFLNSNKKEEMINYISSLNEKEKKVFLNKLNRFSQSINFANFWELYEKKLLFRKVLIDNAPNDYFKQNLIKYSIFDLQDMLNRDFNIQNIKHTLEFLSTYKEYLKNTSLIKNNDLKYLREKLEIMSQKLDQNLASFLKSILNLENNK